MAENDTVEEWTPKTRLGEKVFRGDITSITDVLRSGEPIREPPIVDMLVPNLEDEIILTGGTPGKGGGKRRVISKRTIRMHKSGQRFTSKVLVSVGNGNGILGIGEAGSEETRTAIEKAIDRAKLNIIEVVRGCGSWECGCGSPHSIPFTVEGKCGSVSVELMPAPKGIGLAVSDEVKKVMRLAGIEDIWIKSHGTTKTRESHIKAVMHALSKLNAMNVNEETREATGMVAGLC